MPGGLSLVIKVHNQLFDKEEKPASGPGGQEAGGGQQRGEI